MILAKAPLRVSLFGGGSDIPVHYLSFGGGTISMAINKYVYVAVSKTPHNHIKLSYSQQELVQNVDDIKNDIVRNVLKYYDIKGNIDISTFADLPTVGSGLAGSSAFTCALIVAMNQLYGRKMNEYQVAEAACHIEINMCGWNIGKQDQYASAFGGMNWIQYKKSGDVKVHKMNPSGIEKYMVLVPTNITRHAAEILNKIDFKDKCELVDELATIAFGNYISNPDPVKFGISLDECWKIKKQLETSISNPDIDELYDRCKKTGAYGCKLLGAGGGGYMLVITPEIQKVMDTFNDRTCLTFDIAQEGSRVVYHD
jgi:D-glycero-alpha-D-manno-heptose-7-phosphate kinase